MSTSENKKKERLSAGIKIYAFVTVFCLIVFLVYDRFSHGVRSPYMTFLFLWPLVLGLIPGILFWRFPRIPRQKRISANLYHAGVATVTVSSFLRGVFEIARTASHYQEWLMIAGVFFLFSGVFAYLEKK